MPEVVRILKLSHRQSTFCHHFHHVFFTPLYRVTISHSEREKWIAANYTPAGFYLNVYATFPSPFTMAGQAK